MSEDRPPWEGDVPALRREHLLDAQLFCDRLHMIERIGPAKADKVVELGVAVGQFSRALIQRYDPAKFYAIDTFQLHEVSQLWGRPAREIFGDFGVFGAAIEVGQVPDRQLGGGIKGQFLCHAFEIANTRSEIEGEIMG